MEHQNDINQIPYTWNHSPSNCLKATRIDDDIRDAIQGAYIRKPSIVEKQELLELSARIGIYTSVLGFPAISAQETEECRKLVQFIVQYNLPVMPIFLARAVVKDLEPIVMLRQEFQRDIRPEIFIAISPLRRTVEKWDFEYILRSITTCGQYLTNNQTSFGISLEDASRTPPVDLKKAIKISLDAGAKSLTICDTVGECKPDGAAYLTEFVLELNEKYGRTVDVVWHGHNDKGLSVANAIAAAEAGANIISGTFLGIGERAGNTPLEQIIFLLFQAGNQQFDLKSLYPYCQALAKYTQTDILPTAPLVGSQAFATSAGTHAAAILKARQLGSDVEDAIYSGVSASVLGRKQDILIGPTSGQANARYILNLMGISATEKNIQKILNYAKEKDCCLNSKDIDQLKKTESFWE